MKKPTVLKLISATIAALGLAVIFQNCAQPNAFNVNSAPSSLPVTAFDSGGNGHGYGGKPYISVSTGAVCADGSAIVSRIILIDDTHGSLDRENCRDITPPRAVVVALSVDGLSLVFDGAVFKYAPSASATPTPTPAPAAPTATPTPTPTPVPQSTPQYYNFVAGDEATCESSIQQRLGTAHTCTIGGGCAIDGVPPSSSDPSANPSLWGACIYQ